MSVYQYKNGTWYFYFMLNGKRYHEPIYTAKSEKEAEQEETIFKADLLQGKSRLAINKGKMSFETLVEKFKVYSESNKLSHNTDKSRLIHIEPFFAGKAIKEITSFDIEKYKSHRLKQKTYRKTLVSKTTVNREIEVISKMFNIAIDNGWILSNPCKNVKKLRQDNKIERFLTPVEEKKLLNACTGIYAYMNPIILMALHTAARRKEILTLEWEQVDLKRVFITFTKTKNGKVRKIPLSETLTKELQKLNKDKLSECVFTNPLTKQKVIIP